MSRLTPLERSALGNDLSAVFEAGDEIMGFTANDALLMARRPPVLRAVLGLVQACYQTGSVDLTLKKLVAVMTSSAAGCQYCEAHTQNGALNEGVPVEKLKALWEYRESSLFTEAERAALEVARSAALSPNETSDESFNALKEHYSSEQIVEIVAVISLFGFLNRWNSTMATDLEQVPRAALEKHGL